MAKIDVVETLGDIVNIAVILVMMCVLATVVYEVITTWF